MFCTHSLQPSPAPSNSLAPRHVKLGVHGVLTCMPVVEEQHGSGSMNYINKWFTGTLPDAWGAAGAFPALSILLVQSIPLTGSLPAPWGQQGAFPALQILMLGAMKISGVHLRLSTSCTQKCHFGGMKYA